VIGIYFLADGVVGLLQQGAFWKLGGLAGEPSVSKLSEDVARVVVGACLFLGAHGIVGFWRKLRVAGLPKDR
jgi:hypothetical protein